MEEGCAKIFVTDDPQTTLTNLINLSSVSRMRLLLELIIIVSQAFAAVWFYKLFCDINKWASLALVIWGTVNSVIILVSAISINTLIDIANASSITFQEKLGFVVLLSKTIDNAWSVGGLFFGLWLIPMGYIVVSSRRMPVWLGRILIIGGVGYLIQTFLHSFGLQNPFISILTIPATIGELWIIGYLLIYGIRPHSNKSE